MSDPFDSKQRRRLVLKRGRERAVANRHPWIFAGAIAGERGPADAAVADLVDERGDVVASGFHSQHSQIRLRALTFGAPLTAELVRTRIARAIARRTLDANTNAMRLVHAEGDDVSGLVIDRYDDVVVIEIANEGLDRLRDLVVDVVRREVAPRVIHFKNDIPARKLERIATEPETIVGQAILPVRTGDIACPTTTILENGLRFRVDAATGQKTGFFLDQRDNRALVRTVARGRRTLNLFSYSGAFGVYAAAGGAASVENVDVSAPAIGGARLNHDLNALTDNVKFTVADAFSFVNALRS